MNTASPNLGGVTAKTEVAERELQLVINRMQEHLDTLSRIEGNLQNIRDRLDGTPCSTEEDKPGNPCSGTLSHIDALQSSTTYASNRIEDLVSRLSQIA